MTLFPASAVLIVLWLFRSLKGIDNGIPLVIAVLPLGMFAAVKLGGLSIIASPLLAMLTIMLFIVRWVQNGAHLERYALPPEALYLLFFGLYTAFSATILVRIFAGDFLIFPMNVTSKGTIVSFHFPSTMRALAPSMSNIAQTLYVLLSCGFFISALGLFTRSSPRIGEIGLAWAAGLNILLGFLDLLNLDALLSVIRTADYTLASEHTMGGFARIIGGYSEASVFGAGSAGLFSYFAMSYLIGRRTLHGGLAFGSLVCAIISFSSSGLVAVAVALFVIALHLRAYFKKGMSREFAHWMVISVALAVASSVAILNIPSISDTMSDIVDRLVFSKRDSMSGMERGAWAWAALDAFVNTWGLGAGAGSLRGNGYVSVLMGSVGLPGTLAFMGFLMKSIGTAPVFQDLEDRRMFFAGRVSALTALAALLIAGTTPDPTLFLMTTAAITSAARVRALQHTPHQGVIAQEA